MFEEFLLSVADSIGTTQAGAGIMLSVLLTGALDLVLGIATQHVYAIFGGTILGIVFFVVIGWFPVWTGAVLGIIFALLFASSTLDTVLRK